MKMCLSASPRAVERKGESMDSSVWRSLRLILAGFLLPVVTAAAGNTALYQRGQVQPSDRPGAPTAWTCAIVGSVTTPAAYTIEPEDFTAAALVEQAGGLTADSSGILRIVRNGVARIQIPISAATTERLLPGDVVIAEYSRDGAARLAAPANGLAPVCVIGLSNRPVVLPLRTENATLGTLLALLRQSPEIAPSVRAIRPLGSPAAIGDRLTAGTVLVFDGRVLNWQSLATVDAFPPAIPVRLPEPNVPGSGPATVHKQPPVMPDSGRPPIMLPAPDAAGTVASASSEPATAQPVPEQPQRVASRMETVAAPALTPPLTTPPLQEPGPIPQASYDAPDADVTVPETTPVSAELSVATIDSSAEPVAVGLTDDAEPEPAAAELMAGTSEQPAVDRSTAAVDDGMTHADVAEPGDTAAERPGESVAGQDGTIWLLVGMAFTIGTCLAGAFAWFRWEQSGTPTRVLSTRKEIVPPRPELDLRASQDYLLTALIENRIPLIEEETVVRPIGPVQGTVTGRRHLMVDEAHTELRGPHISMVAERAGDDQSTGQQPLKVLQTAQGLHRVDRSSEMNGPSHHQMDGPPAQESGEPPRQDIEPTTRRPVLDDVVLPETADKSRTSSEHTADLLERALLAMERERRK